MARLSADGSHQNDETPDESHRASQGEAIGAADVVGRRAEILDISIRRHASRVAVVSPPPPASATDDTSNRVTPGLSLVVEFTADASLVDQLGLEQDLSVALGVPVSVISQRVFGNPPDAPVVPL